MSKASPAPAPYRGRGAVLTRRRRARGAGVASVALAAAVVAAAALAACAPATWLAACGSPANLVVASPTPGVTSPGAPGAGATAPAPGAVVTSGPVPAGALRAATRYWRLIDEHRYAGLLAVVTSDSTCAAAVRGGRAAAYFGIERARVVSYVRQVDPAPPALTTLEFTMTIDIRPSSVSAWNDGETLVFMCLRHAGGRWLVYDAGSGP